MPEIVVPIINDEYKVVVLWGSMNYVTNNVIRWGYSADDIEWWSNWRGKCIYSRDTHPVIILKSAPVNPKAISTLCHEAIHAVTHIFDYINEESRDEAFAHCIAGVVRTVLERISK